MKLKYYRFPIIAMLTFTVLAVSCKEEWENHYYAKAANKSELNIYEYIQSRAELSTFSQMLKNTGYNVILAESQTYTVWAPNNTALEGVDLNDSALVNRIVKNHITRFSCTTFGIGSKSQTILMLNNKLLPFAKNNVGYTFGGKAIVLSDIATANGIVHILGEYVPYKMNLWEFISKTDGLDSLKTFINSLTKLELDVEKSFQDDIFVDSIKKETNIVFDRLAALNTEDSIYTAILPDNNAWSEAYSRIFPFYKTQVKDGGIAKQVEKTKLTLISDLFFKGRKTLPIAEDSLESTGGTNFANPDRLFSNAQLTEMSNGLGFVTGQLKNTAVESWYKEIRIEAEWTWYGRATSNYAASQISSIGTGYKVSGGNYISLVPTTSSNISKVFVTFPIPGSLSAKYNIYCVFVPGNIVDVTDTKPNKVKFYLSYINNAGVQVKDAAIDINNTVLTPTATPAIFTTDPTMIHKMLVAKDFEFAFCNSDYNPADPTKPITVSLKVENAVRTTETTFNRTMRIDCIILEPVQ